MSPGTDIHRSGCGRCRHASFAVGSGQASAPPVGALPSGPVSTITTTKGE